MDLFEQAKTKKRGAMWTNASIHAAYDRAAEDVSWLLQVGDYAGAERVL